MAFTQQPEWQVFRQFQISIFYAHQHSKNIRHVWISSSQETVENLLNKGFEAYHLDSRKAKLLSLRAGAFIYSSYITSICNAAFTGVRLV
jgi:hypothetical protein